MAAGYSVTISVVDQATAKLDAVNRHFDGMNKRLAAIRAPTDKFNASTKKFRDNLAAVSKDIGLDGLARRLDGVTRKAASFSKVVLEAVPAIAALGSVATIGGIYKLAETFGNMGVRLNSVSARAGVTASGLRTIENAGRLANVPTEAMDASLTSLRDTMVDIQGGRAADAHSMMNLLGYSMADAAKFAKDPIAALPVLADKIASIKNPTLQARVATALFGGSAEALLPLLRQGSAGFAAATEAAKRHGVVTDDGIKSALDFTRAETSVTESVEGLGTSIGEKLTPVLTPLLNQMSKWIDKNSDWLSTEISAKVGDLVTYLKSLNWSAIGQSIQNFAESCKAVAEWIVKWKTAIIDVFLLFEGARFTLALAKLATMAFAWAGVGRAAKAAGLVEAEVVAASGGGAAAAGAETAAAGSGGFLSGLIGKLAARALPLAARALPIAAFLEALSGGSLNGNEGAMLAAANAGKASSIVPEQSFWHQIGAGLDRFGLFDHSPDMDRPYSGDQLAWMRTSGPINRIRAMTSGYAGPSATRPPDPDRSPAPSDKQRAANEAESFKFWVDQGGLTPEQASGMVANERKESNFDPADVYDGGLAKGSFQWHPERRDNILRGTGIDVATDMNHLHQLQAMLWEITHPVSEGGEKPGGDRLRATSNSYDAGAVASRFIERPGVTPADQDREADARGGSSEDSFGRLYDSYYKNRAAALTPPTAAAPTTSESVVKGQATVRIQMSGAPAGTTTTSSTSGDLFTGAPRVETGMPQSASP